MPDAHSRPSTALATIQPAFTDAERLALSGYLAGYRDLTREVTATCSPGILANQIRGQQQCAGLIPVGIFP